MIINDRYPCCGQKARLPVMGEDDTTYKRKCPKCGRQFTVTRSQANYKFGDGFPVSRADWKEVTK